ncbi:TetR family transcriptional regulator [Arthrobacter sp. H5]|uniref:TetR/AcrR family transcriptional regulator n=1 Tax=Arthrobacter sp. H5 TaxID=1267973 RepID=UPI0004BC07BC|nr:TetR family transcriptional regulator [Arthrobacter sp. H5]
MTAEGRRILRGRRAGKEDTRSAIIQAARSLFAEHGFEGTSLRQIARSANVDPALIHHYFDGKEGLFAACIELPADPATALAGVVAAPPDQRGEALLRAILGLWDSPAQPALLTLLRGAVGSKRQAELMREVFGRRILVLVTTGMDDDDTRLRGSLAASQIMGLMLARYVIKLEPLASLSHDELVRNLAPTVQRYLTGEL